MEYRLRVTRWARGISLRVTSNGDLEVIAPRRYAPRAIARILAQEATWIHTAQGEAAARRRLRPPAPPWRLPTEIRLPAVNAYWTLMGHATAARGVRVTPSDPARLVVSGQIADVTACRRALGRWLLRQGQAHLPSRLDAVSHACGLSYARSTVRLARSRWGSCSRSGVISLNARLLLVPAPLVDYVCVHELCHTQVPNHSPAFWRLVGRHCPSYPDLRAELRVAGRALPEWVLNPQEQPGR